MSEQKKKSFPIIFLNQAPKADPYKGRGGGKQNLPIRSNPRKHFESIRKQYIEVLEDTYKEKQNRKVIGLDSREGLCIEFRGQAGKDLISKSLEDQKTGIRILNSRLEVKEGQEVEIATIFIPIEAEEVLLTKIEQYGQSLEGEKLKNANLVNSIEQIKRDDLNSYWQDDSLLIPDIGEFVWCEVWLKADEIVKEKVLKNFTEICKKNKIDFNVEQSLTFPDRIVVLIKSDKSALETLIKTTDLVAEFRRAKETAKYWISLNRKEQAEWIEDLQKRLSVDKSSNVSILILDTGANWGHPLLSDILNEHDCFTVNESWGTNDSAGHGTLMCGIAGYGELEKALLSKQMVRIFHSLESSKILPHAGNDNDPLLYGYQTQQGISRTEIKSPNKTRILCMAVSSFDGRDRGKPSSWSGEIDKVTSGAEDNLKRLMFISAGTIQDLQDLKNYPSFNETEEIHDPGQSWNALTVGAITHKNRIDDEKKFELLANAGELSPFSCMSLTWDNKWPIKPEIVFEGGNAAKDSDGFVADLYELSILSTDHDFQRGKYFTSTQGTSPATAYASWMAAQIQVRYPNAWPETIRALMVHSAEWPDKIKKQFQINENKKSDLAKLLRICGYGEPNLDKATSCMESQLSLVSEQTIQPYKKENGLVSLNEMHLHELPWPKDELLKLGEKSVKLKVTLSYFVEPSPGERGWKDKYRYASFGLRFALKQPGDNDNDGFVKRVNRFFEREDDESTSENWTIGKKARDKGSIHSDFWIGSAADLSDCDVIAVFPVGGWWKDRIKENKCDKQARYSLIVSLECLEDVEIDIYTPVINKIKLPIEVII
jgi:hypothetical protein